MDLETQNVSTVDKLASTQDLKKGSPLLYNERPSAPEPILTKPLKEYSPKESNFKQHRNDKDIGDQLTPKLGPSPLGTRDVKQVS